MITAIIIDDEQQARGLLKNMLLDIDPEIKIVAECGDLPNGIKNIRKLKPNVVFLDIEMPGHSGLEILDFFNEEEIDFEIVFVTAYNQYAINAFKVAAMDYLLKPVAVDELARTIARLKRSDKKSTTNFETLKSQFLHTSVNRIAVPTANEIRFIELADIIYLKADSSYTEIHFSSGEKLIVSRTLKNFEEVISVNSGFFRCHKSYIVNVRFIKQIVKSDGGFIELTNGTSIPLSPDKQTDLLDQITMVKRN